MTKLSQIVALSAALLVSGVSFAQTQEAPKAKTRAEVRAELVAARANGEIDALNQGAAALQRPLVPQLTPVAAAKEQAKLAKAEAKPVVANSKAVGE